MKKFLMPLLVITLFSFTTQSVNGQTKKRDEVKIKNQVFEVLYSEILEQPKWLIYKSTNRPTNVNRGSMDFYVESNVHTSDGGDYKTNVYDKGHLAPAATFSDNIVNLKQTFSYLNCALQDQYMNRGEWRLLEEQERKWDDVEPLTIKVELIFLPKHIILPSGGHVPSNMVKHIYFEKTKKWKCFDFPNQKPTKGWESYEIKHKH
jgi:DNA/RNA endonuclease G (NUC1)